jgi:pSer/pThr/pTyr-binding forkhead associated (FHA) protein
VQSGPWGPPPNPPTTPTMPTVQAPFSGDASQGGTTIGNTIGSATEEPTVVTEPEVLEPTARAPEVLAPTLQAPEVRSPTTPESATQAPTLGTVATADYLGTVAVGTSMETRVAEEEEVEVTITGVNESPAKLMVTRNGQSREFLLRKPDISIGRAPSNDIALSGDQLASRRHALIHFDGVNYVIRDLVSANGTYINGVELRSPTPLNNGDHVGIGEHELIFFAVADTVAEPTVTVNMAAAVEANPVTVPVEGRADTLDPSYRTRSDSGSGIAWETEAVAPPDEQEEVKTTTEAAMVVTEGAAGAVFAETISTETQTEDVAAYAAPRAPSAPLAPEMPEATIIERIELTEESSGSAVEEEEVEEVAPVDLPLEERLQPTETVNEEDMPLPVPQLPEIPAILSAIKSLDSTTAEMRENLRRAKALEEEAEQLRDQLRAATEAISGHDNSVAVLAQRLRVGVADVSNRLNKVIEEVQRADESLSIADIMKLIDDVRNDPRDIYTLGSLARRARELAQFFELHQHVNQILSECLSTLTDLLSPDLAKPDA